MQSSLISKIEKARRYAQDPDRVHFTQFKATFQGEHDLYTVTYEEGEWHCTCHFFSGWNTCSHTMAMQRIMGDHLPGISTKEPAVSSSTG
ncbi:MAG: hypothetical protein M1337_03665 [Actinobacteria bacterium]|nr:hypothetical protein [Actinomycetota bacterium]MCL5025730.1 hypothetical protein [Chloroflexota bacterium]